MNLVNLPAIATSISSLLGLIGFIFYCIIYFSNRSSSPHLTKEIIDILKSNNINIAEATSLSPAKLKLLLANQTNISKDILSRGIEREIVYKARFLLYISSGSLFCAFVFGIIYLTRPINPTTYSGYVLDKNTAKPISNAVVYVENRKDISSQRTDDNGLFQLKVIPSNLTLRVEHESYRPIAVRKLITSDNELDSFLLDPKSKFKDQTIVGTVVDENNKSLPLDSVKIYVMGNPNYTISNEIGYFTIRYKQGYEKRSRIRAMKKGYALFDEYISPEENDIIISLRREQ